MTFLTYLLFLNRRIGPTKGRQTYGLFESCLEKPYKFSTQMRYRLYLTFKEIK